MVPPPRRGATTMSPPIARAICLTDDSPSPAPPKRVAMLTFACENGRNRRLISPSVRPISDSGIGLTLGEIKRLFRPFSQANVSIATRFGGAGLGLSSVKQIARAMGGDIVVAPRRGGGTIFTLAVTLTRSRASRAAEIAAADRSLNQAQPLRLLSVEDNPFGRVVLNAILTQLPHPPAFT